MSAWDTTEVTELQPLRKIVSEYVQVVVYKCGGNLSEAARILGLHRHRVSSIVETATCGTRSASVVADLADKMNRFENLCTHLLQGSPTPGKSKAGDLYEIARQDFGLTLQQTKLCITKAKEFVRQNAKD